MRFNLNFPVTAKHTIQGLFGRTEENGSLKILKTMDLGVLSPL